LGEKAALRPEKRGGLTEKKCEDEGSVNYHFKEEDLKGGGFCWTESRQRAFRARPSFGRGTEIKKGRLYRLRKKREPEWLKELGISSERYVMKKEKDHPVQVSQKEIKERRRPRDNKLKTKELQTIIALESEKFGRITA